MYTEKEIKENIRTNLYNLRIEYKLTQTDFGKIVDKKKTTVATWESGRSLPDLSTLFMLSRYFNKSMDYMYSDNNTNGKKYDINE